MGRDRISLNGRRRLRPRHRPHPPFLRSVIPPSLSPGSLLQSGIASESSEREGESPRSLHALPRRRRFPNYGLLTAIRAADGRRVKPEGRKGTGGRDPEAGGKRHKKPEPAELSDPPSRRSRLRLFEGMDPIILDARAQHDTAAFPLPARSPRPNLPQSVPTNEVAELGNRF